MSKLPHLHALKMPDSSWQTRRSPILNGVPRGERCGAIAVEGNSVVCSGCFGRAASTRSAKLWMSSPPASRVLLSAAAAAPASPGRSLDSKRTNFPIRAGSTDAVDGGEIISICYPQC